MLRLAAALVFMLTTLSLFGSVPMTVLQALMFLFMMFMSLIVIDGCMRVLFNKPATKAKP